MRIKAGLIGRTYHILTKYSLGKRFLKRYILWILLPLLIATTFLMAAFYYINRKHMLYQQKAYLETVGQIFDEPMEQVHSMQRGISGITELQWFLREDYYSRSELLYTYIKSTYPLLHYLKTSSPNLEEIQIYSRQQNVLRVWPFEIQESFPLDGEEADLLKNARPDGIYWRIVPSGDSLEKPDIYAYFKYYSSDYVDLLGYVEILLKNDFLDEYAEALYSNEYSRANFYLSTDEGILYEKTTFPVAEKQLQRLLEKQEDFGLYRDCSWFRADIPEYGLSVLTMISSDGLLSDYLIPLSLGALMLMAGLLLLSLLFFREIFGLCKRMGEFSAYMERSDGNVPVPYEENQVPDGWKTEDDDEFRILIRSFNAMMERNEQLNKRCLKLELLNKDASLAALQAQINPHFIYGTLETIRILAVQNDDEPVEGLVCSFARLMRYCLNHPSGTSTIKKELEANRYYMDIQMLRFSERLGWEVKADPKLPDLYCPPFIIQPLLENALAHGVSRSLERCEVSLETFLKRGDYIIRINNSGAAPDPKRLELVNRVLEFQEEASRIQGDKSGFGLSNVAERLKLFYNGAASLRLYCADGRTSAVIRIREKEWRKQICSDS